MIGFCGAAGICSILHDVNPNSKKKKKGMNNYCAVNSSLIYDFVKLILI